MKIKIDVPGTERTHWETLTVELNAPEAEELFLVMESIDPGVVSYDKVDELIIGLKRLASQFVDSRREI